MNGLPQCAGCLKKFSRWQTLQQHINNNSCPAVVPSNRAKPPGLTADPPSTATAELHSDSAREYHPVDTATSAALAEETTATSRMETEPQHVTSIDSFPERQLQLQRIVPHGVNHFIRFPELTQTMLRTCMLCGQWVASHKVMNFITEIHIHRLVSSYNNEPAASLNNEPRLVRPVTFAVVNTRTGRHTCTNALLFGNAPCFVLCTRRSTMMDEQMAEFFGDVKTEKQLPRPVERVLASNDRGPQPLRDAQRQTQTRAVPRASTTAATAAIPFPVRSVPKGSLDHYFGQNRPATTGGTQGAASGHRLHTLPETGRGRGHECVVQGGADFQGQAGSGAGMAARSTTSPNGPGL